MLANVREIVRGFFYREEVPYSLAVVRIGLPLALLLPAVPRWVHVREIFSTDGATAPLWLNYGYPSLLPEPSAPIAVALYSVLLFCLLSAALGWMTRASLAVAAFLYPYFGMLDSMGTLTKYTAISTHALLVLALSGCGTIWSVDAWLERRRRRSAQIMTCPVWPRRLLQLLIGIVYLGAAFTKMHTPAYFSGDQLTYWMLANVNLSNSVGEFLSQRPSLLIMGAYATIVWETLFVFLMWKGIGRIMMLGLGVVFHVLTAFTLGLIIFPIVCLAIYPIFLEEDEVSRVACWGREWLSRALSYRRLPSLVSEGEWRLPAEAIEQTRDSPVPQGIWSPRSALTFGVVTAALMVISVETEYRLDVYGERRASGRHTLEPMDEHLAQAMLGPTRPVRPQDLYFNFEVGTELVGGILSDRRTTFRHGDQAVVQCSLNPPHPDMWLEVVMQDAENQIIFDAGKIVPREDLRVEFHYHFAPLLAPGEYDFVLRYEGHEITRRRVSLVSDSMLTASH